MKPLDQIKKGSNKAHSFKRIKQDKKSKEAKRERQQLKTLVNDTTNNKLTNFYYNMKDSIKTYAIGFSLLVIMAYIFVTTIVSAFGGKDKAEAIPSVNEKDILLSEIKEQNEEIFETTTKLNSMFDKTEAKIFRLRAVCLDEGQTLSECLEEEDSAKMQAVDNSIQRLRSQFSIEPEKKN